MSQQDVWNRFLKILYTSDEDTPVPSDYTFSFSLEPQRRAVYQADDRYYPAPPRFVNPWHRIDDPVDTRQELTGEEGFEDADDFLNNAWDDDPATRDYSRPDPTDHGNQGSYDWSATAGRLTSTKRVK